MNRPATEKDIIMWGLTIVICSTPHLFVKLVALAFFLLVILLPKYD